MQAVHQKAAYNKTMSSALVKWSKPGIIYVARNRVNGKLYVGQTIKSLVNVSPEVLKRRMEGRLANPYVASEEDKRKISEGKRGKKVSAEGRANISAAHMGIHKGYVHSEESKRNMSEGKRRWWAKRKSANKSQISLDFGHGRREL
jgi:hypothetical protein